MPALKVSTGPPNRTSIWGLFFSAITRARASPEEKRTKLTLMPVAFSNSSNMGRAQFSGQMEYALSVLSAAAPPDAVRLKRIGNATIQGRFGHFAIGTAPWVGGEGRLSSRGRG